MTLHLHKIKINWFHFSSPEEHKRVEHVVKEETEHRHKKDQFKVEEKIKVTMGKIGKANSMEELDYDLVEQKTEPKTTTPEPTPEVFCSDLEYDHFKGILLQYHCARIGENNCGPDSPRKLDIFLSFIDMQCCADIALSNWIQQFSAKYGM